MEREIMIENVGPIERLTIPLPESGVVVLRGRNGIGKSHALAAVDSLVSGRGRPPCRDGAAKGTVEGFGAKLSIGRSTRRTGEAEVLSLEGRLDISQLVQPPIKDEEAADRTRIKALIQLSGRPADAAAFDTVLPPGIALVDLVPLDDQGDDPVTLASRIKRGLEAEARRLERIADEAKAEESLLAQELADAPVDEPIWHRIRHQPDVVRAEAETAVASAMAEFRELETRREMAAQQAERIAHARKALAELEAADCDASEKIGAEIADLDEKIRMLEQALAVAKDRRTRLARRREEAERVQSRIADLRRIVSGETPKISDAEIAEARAKLDAARRRYDSVCDLIRKEAISAKREGAAKRAKDAESRAEVLRDAARATDDVLSSLVGAVTNRLRVEAGRLVCDTERGAEPFGELSPGERWRVALEIAVEQLGRGGIVTVPQDAWEALDPINREEIAKIAADTGVVIITAEAASEASITPEVIACRS